MARKNSTERALTREEVLAHVKWVKLVERLQAIGLGETVVDTIDGVEIEIPMAASISEQQRAISELLGYGFPKLKALEVEASVRKVDDTPLEHIVARSPHNCRNERMPTHGDELPSSRLLPIHLHEMARNYQEDA